MYFFLILNYVRSNEAGETVDADDKILYLLRVILQKIRHAKNTHYAVCFNRYKNCKFCIG